MGEIFFDITVVLCIASFLSIVFRFLKQPPILAYLLSGIIIGPLALLTISNLDTIKSFAEIGITLLLFTLGLELRFSELRSVGKSSLLVGLLQIIVTFSASYLLSAVLGFPKIEAIYVSLALTFSSTIIVVKLLSDKKDLQSLYGKISIGILLVQDFAAIFALILLSGIGSGTSLPSFHDILVMSLKAIVLFGWTYVLGITVLPFIVQRIARSPEILFLFSLAFAFGMSALVSSPIIGFSIEIGGFLAGLALANTSENFQISSKVRSLRDFFIIIFFVLLGIQMVFVRDFSVLVPILILLVFVVILKPIIVMGIMGLLNHRKRTSFLTAVSFAQVSEFSFILLFAGNSLNQVSDKTMAIVIAVGSITFVSSNYFIIYAGKLYRILSPYLRLFERTDASEKKISTEKLENHIILVGLKRMGGGILEALRKDNENKIVVVDFDPDIIESLKNDGLTAFFGDIADPEIQELAGFDKARLIISTVSDPEDNFFILDGIRRLKKKPTVVLLALEKEDAKEFYRMGADYVVLPHLAGGHHLAKILVEKDHLELIERYRKKDLESFLR